jgi:hypothetical protein
LPCRRGDLLTDHRASIRANVGPNDQGARLCGADYKIMKVAIRVEPAGLLIPPTVIGSKPAASFRQGIYCEFVTWILWNES